MYYLKHILLQANIGYDLLVGADGAASAVRLALQQIMPASYVRRYRHKQVYSMTQMTPANPAKIPPYAVFHAHSAKVQNLLEAICCFGSGICKCAQAESYMHPAHQAPMLPKGAAALPSVYRSSHRLYRASRAMKHDTRHKLCVVLVCMSKNAILTNFEQLHNGSQQLVLWSQVATVLHEAAVTIL